VALVALRVDVPRVAAPRAAGVLRPRLAWEVRPAMLTP